MTETLPHRVHVGLSRLKRLMIDPYARGALAARWLSRGSIHQDTPYTKADRYPELFAQAGRMLGRDGMHDILSFGCSTGEEVVTLRRYFSAARIVGAEINRACLATCRRLPVDGHISFIASDRRTIGDAGPFDAIFCMAVLQRRPHDVIKKRVRNIAQSYPFAHFEDEIAFLTGCLKENGVLFVEHAHYLVTDTTSMTRLAIVAQDRPLPPRGDHFDPAGDLIDPKPRVEKIFRRLHSTELSA